MRAMKLVKAQNTGLSKRSYFFVVVVHSAYLLALRTLSKGTPQRDKNFSASQFRIHPLKISKIKLSRKVPVYNTKQIMSRFYYN